MASDPPADEAPVWARGEAFPNAGKDWGWMDQKGRRVSCASFAELEEEIVKDAGAKVDLVWTPDRPHMVLPEELPDLQPAMREARIRWARWEIEEGKRQMVIFGLFLGGVLLFSILMRKEVLAFGPAGLALLLLVVLGVIPWYQGRKRLERAKAGPAARSKDDLLELRFEIWLMHQKAPLTTGLLVAITVVGLCQWMLAGSVAESVQEAGLTKINGRPSDWWRLLTAPFLHGHWVHFLMNGAALHYLGRRMEVLARWPHVAMVFLMAAWVGGEASARFSAAPSIGASGGLMGLLGFLLVFEWAHRTLVPMPARRRLVTGVVLTGVIGVLFPMVDNAAHLGGLVAGMVYALVVFPKSDSNRRPGATLTDRVAGSVAVAVLGGSALWACVALGAG